MNPDRALWATEAIDAKDIAQLACFGLPSHRPERLADHSPSLDICGPIAISPLRTDLETKTVQLSYGFLLGGAEGEGCLNPTIELRFCITNIRRQLIRNWRQRSVGCAATGRQKSE